MNNQSINHWPCRFKFDIFLYLRVCVSLTVVLTHIDNFVCPLCLTPYFRNDTEMANTKMNTSISESSLVPLAIHSHILANSSLVQQKLLRIRKQVGY